jgi:hypothetical protein
LSQALLGVTEANSLNAYYNPTYHFRLFVAGDADIMTQAQNNIANITSGAVPQVTIVESGVTGASIRNVEINTFLSHTGPAKDQYLQDLTMTVIDPLGMSFLDGLVEAAGIMGSSNYTKMPYYVQLTFKAYDEQGYPMQAANLPNGGVWIWAVLITGIEVKITEAGGVFDLQMVPTGTGGSPDCNKNEEQRNPQALVVSGKTVSEIFQDFTTQINNSWKNSTGGPLVQIAVVTHPITIGPTNAIGLNPGNFKMKSTLPFQSSERTWQFSATAGDDGKVTCHVPPNASVSEFLTATIKSTEQAQALMKDQPITTQTDSSTAQVNSRGYRDSVLFSVEVDPMNVNFDTNTNNYMKQVTFHVVAHSTQSVILGPVQLAQATTPQIQNAMLQNFISKGMIKKRYDYIYTGLNTEVLDFQIECNLAFSVTLSKYAGSRAGYNNTSVNSVLSGGNTNPQGTLNEASAALKVDPGNNNSTVPVASGSTPTNTASGATNSGGSIATSGATAASMTTPAANSNPISTSTPAVSGIAPTSSTSAPGVAATSQVTTNSTTPSQISASQNIYVEDVLASQFSQQPNVPISFKYGNNDTQQESGSRVNPGQFHRDQSVIGSIFTQMYQGTNCGGLGENKFFTIHLDIRGDPYWIGQTNLNRVAVIRDFQNNTPTYDPKSSPDFISCKELIYLHFRYPLTVGDDFVPILTSSETFNALYEVYEVKHSFSDGVFKQTLTAFIHPLIADNMGQNAASASPSSGGPPASPQAGPTAPAASTGPSSFHDKDSSESPNLPATPTSPSAAGDQFQPNPTNPLPATPTTVPPSEVTYGTPTP